MFRIRIIFACVALLAIVGAVIAQVRPIPDAAPAYMTDASGRALVLHGFSTNSAAKATEDGLPTITEEELQAEHEDMGTNFVRLLISWRAVEPEPGVYDEEYFDRLEEMIGWYAERGYWVMLDMHQDLWSYFDELGPGMGNGAPQWATYTDGQPIIERSQWEFHYIDPAIVRAFDNFWNNTGAHPELMDHYAGAWGAVAERFGSHPAVIAFDLMNESYGGSVQGPAFEAGVLTELYQRTTDAIREVDSETWVCIEPQVVGFNWGLPSALGPIDDPAGKIAYCPHLYPHPLDLGEDYAGKNQGTIDSVIGGWINNTLKTAERLDGAPIILGEFGLDTDRPGSLEYVEKVLHDMGQVGISTAYWSRDDGGWGPYDSDKNPRNLTQVMNRPYPRAVAGTPLRWGMEGEEFTLTFDSDPSLGTTEFYLPPEQFPDPVVRGGQLDSWDPSSGVLSVVVSRDGQSTVSIRKDTP